MARLMLEKALRKTNADALNAPAALIVLRTCDEAVERVICEHVTAMYPAMLVVQCHSLTQEADRARQEKQIFAALQTGQSVCCVSIGATSAVPESLSTLADLQLTIEPADWPIVRQCIQEVTSEKLPQLTKRDITGLDTQDLLNAIRLGVSQTAVIATLRRIQASKRRLTAAPQRGPKLSNLVLDRNVEAWAEQTVAKLKASNTPYLPYALLSGVPGTGKTTLAAALATTANCTIVVTSVAQWLSIGKGNLGDAIRGAQSFFSSLDINSGKIVGLIDEIDALPNRMALDAKEASWWAPLVTFVLTEIDRTRKTCPDVLLLGATNHPERLDPALVRAGRLEQHIVLQPPNEDTRQRLFRAYLGSGLTESELSTLARLTPHANQAQIEAWCQQVRPDAERKRSKLKLADVLGVVCSPSQRTAQADRAIAIHEAGHAVVAAHLGIPVLEVSVLDLNDNGGWVKTTFRDKDLLSREGIEDHVTMLLAGRAADELLGARPNAGARRDLALATKMLHSAHTELGFYRSLKTGLLGSTAEEQLALSIELQLQQLKDRATEILRTRSPQAEALADKLQSHRVLTGSVLHGALASAAHSTHHSL
ncbi:AAA family ATPase [Devosia sp. MC532]|uniref:AAA family ATPase n=1 Tax=Devosia sp. MC532 TaxID=2799788 RepID=UPI0018F293BF|nr:AAA family ATPase [Devosia sp. MC532]MBJ7578427.1 AAA family ATPase [Devosia sp. MC532]